MTVHRTDVTEPIHLGSSEVSHPDHEMVAVFAFGVVESGDYIIATAQDDGKPRRDFLAFYIGDAQPRPVYIADGYECRPMNNVRVDEALRAESKARMDALESENIVL